LVGPAILVAAELALRLAGWGHPTGFFVRSETGPADLYSENPKFGWRFFPQRLARAPDPIRLLKTKPPGTLRVFVFGESAALGDPAPAYGFSRILREFLEERCPGTKFEVVNFGMTAISSHVVQRIAQECVPFQGDIWIVYMGNNEVIGPFGAGSVFGSKSPPLWLVGASLAAKRTRLGQALDALRERALLRPQDSREWEGMKMMLNEQIRAQDPRLARVYDHFARNLEDILRLAARAGAKTILCSVSSNLKDCPPFASLHRPDLSEVRLSEWTQLCGSGKELESRKEYPQALARFSQAAAIDDSYAELAFRMAQCHLALGESAAAYQEYVHARDLDVLRFRTDSRLNSLIRSVYARQATPGVRFFDAEAMVTNAASLGIPGAEYFWDHVHFNFAGNYLVARGLADQVMALLPEALQLTARTNARILTEIECAQRLALTDWDQRSVLNLMLRRVHEPPFTFQLDQEKRLKRWSELLSEIDRKRDGKALAGEVQAYLNALVRRPDDWILHHRLAFLLESSGDFAGAEEYWRKVLELVPGYPEACFKLADISARKSKLAEAEQYYRQVLRARPTSFEAINGLGLVRVDEGKLDEAARLFERALRIEPEFAQAQVNWGLVASRLGRLAEAEGHYREALRIDPESAGAHIDLANLLAAQKKHAEAIDHYRKAVKVQPGEAAAHLSLGNSLDAVGRGSEAVEQYREAVRLNPALAEAHFNLGVALAKSGDLPGATTCFEEAARLNPEDSQAHLNLGVALAQQNRLRDAIREFEAVLRVEPTNAAARQYLRTATERLKPVK
jgi:tetratricopeptide (TPR) repeat protein